MQPYSFFKKETLNCTACIRGTEVPPDARGERVLVGAWGDAAQAILNYYAT